MSNDNGTIVKVYIEYIHGENRVVVRGVNLKEFSAQHEDNQVNVVSCFAGVDNKAHNGFQGLVPAYKLDQLEADNARLRKLALELHGIVMGCEMVPLEVYVRLAKNWKELNQ